ncbi:MAG TPA: histidine kinase dimerization/phospho-acceptor domain-containing protein [Gemmatimonadales bacterium]|jgi:signal transduction histidine kinase
MPFSRLRLQLAAWFALVFIIGLGAVDIALFSSLKREGERELTSQARATAAGLRIAMRRELVENPGEMEDAAEEALAEWPPDSAGFVIFGPTGQRLASRGPADLTALVPPVASQLRSNQSVWQSPGSDESGARIASAHSDLPVFTVAVALPSTSVYAVEQRLALWLGLSAPLVVLLALGGGYMLARRALEPLRAMTREITAIDAADLAHRLPIRSPPDELDVLAEQFNQLLHRLARAQARNRRFIAQAAHQLRTPLTVIRGESDLGLERERSAAEHRDLLRRVSLAAAQMSHRVDDLLLLAQAESGDRPPVTDPIEVDGLVLECVDLMRGRAQSLGCRLDLATMDPAEIMGNETLVREAVMELLENAFRHGDHATPVSVSTLNGGKGARIVVSSSGEALRPESLTDRDDAASADGSGLGLSIVRWIAEAHGGVLGYRREGATNTFTLELGTR